MSEKSSGAHSTAERGRRAAAQGGSFTLPSLSLAERTKVSKARQLNKQKEEPQEEFRR